MVLVVISPKTFRMDLQKTRCPLGLNWKSESVTMTDSWKKHTQSYMVYMWTSTPCFFLTTVAHQRDQNWGVTGGEASRWKKRNTGAEKEVMWLPQEASKPSLKPLTELPGFQCFVSFVFFCVCFFFLFFFKYKCKLHFLALCTFGDVTAVILCV